MPEDTHEDVRRRLFEAAWDAPAFAPAPERTVSLPPWARIPSGRAVPLRTLLPLVPTMLTSAPEQDTFS